MKKSIKTLFMVGILAFLSLGMAGCGMNNTTSETLTERIYDSDNGIDITYEKTPDFNLSSKYNGAYKDIESFSLCYNEIKIEDGDLSITDNTISFNQYYRDILMPIDGHDLVEGEITNIRFKADNSLTYVKGITLFESKAKPIVKSSSLGFVCSITCDVVGYDSQNKKVAMRNVDTTLYGSIYHFGVGFWFCKTYTNYIQISTSPKGLCIDPSALETVNTQGMNHKDKRFTNGIVLYSTHSISLFSNDSQSSENNYIDYSYVLKDNTFNEIYDNQSFNLFSYQATGKNKVFVYPKDKYLEINDGNMYLVPKKSIEINGFYFDEYEFEIGKKYSGFILKLDDIQFDEYESYTVGIYNGGLNTCAIENVVERLNTDSGDVIFSKRFVYSTKYILNFNSKVNINVYDENGNLFFSGYVYKFEADLISGKKYFFFISSECSEISFSISKPGC